VGGAASSALAPRMARSRSISDRDAQAFAGMVPMTALGDAGRSLDPCTLASAGPGRSVRRQSSLTEDQLSNRCANRKSGRRLENARIPARSRPYRRLPGQGACLVFVQLHRCWRGAAQTATIVIPGRAQREPGIHRAPVQDAKWIPGSMLRIALRCAIAHREWRRIGPCLATRVYFVCVRTGRSFRPLLS
jgi:hypothetical protein